MREGTRRGRRRAAIYARLSKDSTGEHLGVDRQEGLSRDLADRLDLDVVAVIADNDISAFRRGVRRPGWERLVEMMKNGDVDVVVAYHADRLYRRTADLERLVDVVEVTGTEIRTVAAGDVDLSTASGRMVARMLGAAAQHESERTSERMKAKHDELAAGGSAPGGVPPYGYRRRQGGGYEIEPGEAEAVRFMARRLLEGAALLAVGRELEAAGVRTRGGRPWPATTVRATVTRPAVAGLRVHRGEIAGPGGWEPIVERATWEQVRAVIADPARKRARPVRRHLLTGLVFDERGAPMKGTVQTGRQRGWPAVYRTWRPPGARGPMTSIYARDLEGLVVAGMLDAADEVTFPVSPGTVDDGPAREIAEVEAELRQVAGMRGAGVVSMAEWLEHRRAATERLERLREAARMAPRGKVAGGRVAAILGQPGALRKAWDGLGFADQREVLEVCVERIVVCQAGWRRFYDPAERRAAIRARVEIKWKA